jgi:creatinine amidohydrolase
VRIADMNWMQVEAYLRHDDRAVLPLGSTEQHSHLRLTVDCILPERVAAEAAEPLGVPVFPVLPYGVTPYFREFPGSISLKVETHLRVVGDVLDGLAHSGFRRILIVNGHGGNGGVIDLSASTLGHRHYGKARVAALTYFQLAREAIARLRQSGPGGMGHACEFETAMLQHIRPELVRIDRAETTYPDAGSRYLTTDLLGGSAVRVYHDFGDLSQSGTLGDPSLATPEKGAAFFAVVIDELAAFIDDFSRWAIPEPAR